MKNYTAIVTVSLVSDTGLVLGTRSDNAIIEADDDMDDDYMKENLDTMLGVAVHHIQECLP